MRVIISKISINNLIIAFVLLCNILLIAKPNGQNDIISHYSIILTILLSFISVVSLRRGQLKQNPFLTLLGVNLSFFYIFRVTTLTYFEPHNFLAIHRLNSNDYENALQVVLILAFLFNLIFRRLNTDNINFRNFHGISRKTILGFNVFFLIILLINFLFLFVDNPTLKSLIGYFKQVFHVNIVFLFLLVFHLLFKSKIPKSQRFLFYGLIILYVILETLSGNKSGIYKLLFLGLTGYLTVNKNLFLTKKQVMVIPVVIILAISSYFIGNAFRIISRAEGQFSTSFYSTEVIQNTFEEFNKNQDFLMSQLFGRIGYLDNTARMIKNSDSYEPVFTLTYYFKSFFDYTTPGVNLFNTVRISNNISYIDTYRSVPSQTQYSNEEYFSEILTVYGELYNLGGGIIGAMILCIVFGLIIRKISYKILKIRNPLSRTLKYSLLLFCFNFLFLDSFGLDWGFSSVVYYVINLFFLRIIIKKAFQVEFEYV